MSGEGGYYAPHTPRTPQGRAGPGYPGEGSERSSRDFDDMDLMDDDNEEALLKDSIRAVREVGAEEIESNSNDDIASGSSRGDDEFDRDFDDRTPGSRDDLHVVEEEVSDIKS